MLEAHVQTFIASPFFRKIEPSPTELLTFHVTAALLALGLNYSDLQETVADGVWAFVNTCGRTVDGVSSLQAADDENPRLEDAIRVVTIAVAILGFLDAASAQADFWKSGGRIGLIQKIRQLLSEPFLVTLETSLSTIRNSFSQDRAAKEWKRLIRHYALAGKPLGAMLLQRSFMWLVTSSTSLLLVDSPKLKEAHVLDVLMTMEGKLRAGSRSVVETDAHSVEYYASLAVEQMNYLEAGADFVRLGSSDQQQLAYQVKAAALVSFLNCSILNEDAADIDVLMNWLQELLEDPVQMEDEVLASVALRCLALTCHVSAEFSSVVSRLLPRFLVQTVPSSKTVGVASKSLAFALKTLSKDAIISTLYTLGNVLSPGQAEIVSNGNGTGADGAMNGIYAGRQSTGSSISLQHTNEDDTATMYENVVQAICGIATACQDEKITALAQSMLLQKLDKVNAIVDGHIIFGAGVLALGGGQLEFRSLLKMYTRICYLGVAEHNDLMLVAVSHGNLFLSMPLLITDVEITGHESPNPYLSQYYPRLLPV